MSEGGIKKLKETFKWYADKLCIPAVYETFKQTILKNARKLNGIKNETKLLIDELEKQIEEIKQKGLNENNEQTDNNEETAGDSETNNEEDENVPTTKQIAAKKRANTKALSKQNVTKSNANFKKKRGARQKVVTSSSESESDAIESDSE